MAAGATSISHNDNEFVKAAVDFDTEIEEKSAARARFADILKPERAYNRESGLARGGQNRGRCSKETLSAGEELCGTGETRS